MLKISLEYLAGFIDGEGCFNVTRTRKNIYPRLVIVNTNFEILKHIQSIYGGNIQTKKKVIHNWKQGYNLTITWKSFRKLVTNLLPYLIVKKEVAQLTLNMLETKNKEKRLEIKEKVNLLNKKGI